MHDPYLDELKEDFENYSIRLKRLKKKMIKTKSAEMQAKIVKQMDVIATKMENNQKQSAKVTKSRTKKRKTKSKRI